MTIVPADAGSVATLGKEARGAFAQLVVQQDGRRGRGRPDTVEVSTITGSGGFGPPRCGVNEVCGDVQIGSRYRRAIVTPVAHIERTVPANGVIPSTGNHPTSFNGLANDKGLFVYSETVPAWVSGDANFTAQKRWGFTRLSGTNIYVFGKVYGDLVDAQVCGDGLVSGTEQCDPASVPASCPVGQTCNTDCACQTVAVCGNGTIETGEQCELDADCTGGATCSGCQCVGGDVCGDGVIGATEACDTLASPSGCPTGQGCSATCACVSSCGDGAINNGEVCDPAAAPTGCADGVVCLSDCSCDTGFICGNGTLEANEECDPPGGGCPTGETCSIGGGCVCVPTTGEGRPFAVLHAADDNALRSVYDTAVALAELPDSLFTELNPASDTLVLEGAFTAVGLNPGGNMNVSSFGATRLGWDLAGDPETAQVGGTLHPSLAGTIGFRGRLSSTVDFEEDVLSPGCFCEGHGVRATQGTTPIDGGLAESNQDLTAATPVRFAHAYDAAARAWVVRSEWTVSALRVRMDTSLRRDDFYVTQRITMTNTSTTETISDIRLLRTLDYDVGPGHFDDDSFAFLYPFTSGSPSVPQLIRSVDDENPRAYGVATVSPYMTCANGITFMTTDPDQIMARDENGDSIPDCNQDPVVGSPGDRSSSFVFETPALAPGESVTL